MASAAEQLVSNMNFGALAKATELKQRIWFTLGALIVFRLGTHIPLPGIDPAVMAEIFKQNAGGLLGMVNMFAGGAMGRMAIFALGIMPYISASIMVQLLTLVSKELESLKKEGEMGRKKLNQYTRWLTVFLAIIQSYGMAIGLEGMAGGAGGMSVVAEPGWFFRISAVITLTGGALFVLWLAEQITARGVGNGSSMIIFSGIVAGLPMAVASTLELGRTGALSTVLIIGIILMVIAIIAFVVFMERAQRRLIVQYPRRQVGMKMMEGSAQHLPLKINSANVIPPVFASSLLLLPSTVLGFLANDTSPQWLQDLAAALNHGQPMFMLVYAALIIFFCFFYTAIVVNPDDTAENLKKFGGIITGIRPGKNTADYIDYVLTRLTVLGALYLTAVCLFPEFLLAQMPGVPFYLGGTSLLIAVSVTIDTIGQIHSHLLAHQYEGLIKKAKLRGTKR